MHSNGKPAESSVAVSFGFGLPAFFEKKFFGCSSNGFSYLGSIENEHESGDRLLLDVRACAPVG